LDLLGEDLDCVLIFKSVTKLQKLLDVWDSLDDVRGLGTLDHNLSALWSRLDFDSSVSILGEHSLKEFVDLCEKETIFNELSLLGNVVVRHLELITLF